MEELEMTLNTVKSKEDDSKIEKKEYYNIVDEI